MSLDRNKGCGTPSDDQQKQIQERLLEVFAPSVIFDSEERFFPVDLPTTVGASSLWDKNGTAYDAYGKIADIGNIDPIRDLNGISKEGFMTLDAIQFFEKEIKGEGTRQYPKPDLDLIHQKHASGDVGSTLTIYGTVCTVGDIPNYHLFRDHDLGKYENPFREGLVLNYYMFFPASESKEHTSEGDWSGISLLLPRMYWDMNDLNDPDVVERYQPTHACYFKKSIDGVAPGVHYSATGGGLTEWSRVEKTLDYQLQKLTHPKVYVSKGRHNCMFAAGKRTINLGFFWNDRFLSADEIENGKVISTPGGKPTVIRGQTDWSDPALLTAIIFPPSIPFILCAAGCGLGTEFDGSGLPARKGRDETDGDGFVCDSKGPQSSKTPSKYPSFSARFLENNEKYLTLKLEYVDLDDPTMKELWDFSGAWGGATMSQGIFGTDQDFWGYYQGVRRPALAPWFMWSYFTDPLGANGTVKPEPQPV